MMYTARPRVRGMGATVADFCTSVWDYWNPACWAYSPSGWAQQRAFEAQAATIQPPVPPPAVTSTGVSETVPPTTDQATAAINAALAQGATQTQAQNLQTFQQMQPVSDTGGSTLSDLVSSLTQTGGTGISTTALIAIGLVVGGGILIMSNISSRRRRY